MSKIKVLLVDDHQIVRDGIFALLIKEHDIEIVGEASNGDELFEKLKFIKPDIIILDISLPKMSGIEIAGILSKDFPQIRIIVFSSYTDEETIFKSIRAGAKGFLPKDSMREDLVDAIKKVHQGFEYLSDKIPNTILMDYIKKAGSQEEKFNNSKLSSLTKREREILKLIAEGMSYKEIGTELFISVRTVETHKNNILQKLELKSTIDLVKFAIKNDLIDL
jgi:DNA-binding NarL/FixJ family response regulator